MNNSIITEERLEKCRTQRVATLKKRCGEVEKILCKDAADALFDYYSIFDEGYYIWLASLWDPEIGGFYFSQSGRDAEGFLPDIESTVQALRACETMGLMFGKSYAEAVSPKIKDTLIKFTKSLQDENGYFYHPQWGKNIATPRRGRDLAWATGLLEDFDEKPNYLPPSQTTEDGQKSAALPEYLQSTEAFEKYLSEFDLRTRSYWIGNMLQSQTGQIKAAGNEFVDILMNWFKEHQLPENGLWQDVVNYDSVNGLMKISLIYSALGIELPNAKAGLRSAIQVALSDEPITFICQVYNPFSVMSVILSNISKFGSKSVTEQLRKEITDNAATLISITRQKVLIHKRPYGGYGYQPYNARMDTIKCSQCAPVSLGLPDDSDVNGGSISINGTTRCMCQALGIPVIPAFCDEDAKLFHELLENAKQYPKICKKPDWFDKYLFPEGTAWA